MDSLALRKFLIDNPFRIAEESREVLSLNIVGSFSENDGIKGISDIDVVIIVDYLTEWVFRDLIGKFEQLNVPLKECFGMNLRINSTFGPLKYNEPATVVYHIMIYDIAGHLVHCRQSPFTCLDWARTKLYCKAHISEICLVPALMPHHFFNARRGVKEYLTDYDKAVISYRQYRFCDGEIIEDRFEKAMTLKDRYEFAYHIVRFIMLNFIKMLDRNNQVPENAVILQRFLTVFPELTEVLPPWFERLYKYKCANDFPDETTELDAFVRYFLDTFEQGFRRYFPDNDRYISFVRHGRTALNSGTLFLGQRLNPEIIRDEINTETISDFDHVFASPLRRTVVTAQILCPQHEIKTSPLLLELDYGQAEGHDFEWLQTNHPEIIAAWTRGEDPTFPNGEAQKDVLRRINEFIATLLPDGGNRILVVTHNVWLRTLLGHVLGIPRRDWFNINIPHNRMFKFRFHPDGGIMPDLSADDLRILLKKIEQNNFLRIQERYDADSRERYLFWQEVSAQSKARILHEEYDGSCLVPMAGEGNRFKSQGFSTAKPLINIDGQAMIFRVMDCVPRTVKRVYLVRKHMITPELKTALEATADTVKVVPVQQLTEGQACTCLLGIEDVMPDKPLLVAPCDNGMIWSDQKYQELLSDVNTEIICWTFTRHLTITAKPQAWGYVKADEYGNALAVSVKVPMTNNPYEEHCVIGTFWFRSGNLFRRLAEELIRRNIRVNNEFYVDSIIGLAIELGIKVKIFDVDKYISWGKPEDLFEYRKWMRLVDLYA